MSPASLPTDAVSITEDGRCCSIVELREYTLHPGRREDLIELFDRELVETQEELGIHVVGQFRDVDRLDRFVWLRGFADMESRREALAAFYGGPVWAEHCDAANDTMIDSDNVLLLHPTVASLPHPPAGRLVVDEGGVYVIAVSPRAQATDSAGAIAVFETEESENTYPRLPIREGEDVRVTLRRVSSLNQVDPPRDDEYMRLTPTSRSQLR